MNIYVVYLTTYFGSKLPPFYIGSTRLDKIQSGYRGSVMSLKYRTLWKSELTSNPNLFSTKVISTHPTRKDAYQMELKLQLRLNVVNNPMYINMAYANPTGFMGASLVGKDSPHYGMKRSQEAKLRMRNAQLGKKQSLETIQKRVSKFKGIKRSEEFKNSVSRTHKNKEVSENTRLKLADKTLYIFHNVFSDEIITDIQYNIKKKLGIRIVERLLERKDPTYITRKGWVYIGISNSD